MRRFTRLLASEKAAACQQADRADVDVDPLKGARRPTSRFRSLRPTRISPKSTFATVLHVSSRLDEPFHVMALAGMRPFARTRPATLPSTADCSSTPVGALIALRPVRSGSTCEATWSTTRPPGRVRQVLHRARLLGWWGLLGVILAAAIASRLGCHWLAGFSPRDPSQEDARFQATIAIDNRLSDDPLASARGF